MSDSVGGYEAVGSLRELLASKGRLQARLQSGRGILLLHHGGTVHALDHACYRAFSAALFCCATAIVSLFVNPYCVVYRSRWTTVRGRHRGLCGPFVHRVPLAQVQNRAFHRCLAIVRISDVTICKCNMTCVYLCAGEGWYTALDFGAGPKPAQIPKSRGLVQRVHAVKV